MGALSGETEMAKQIVRFETTDGTQFETMAEAITYERAQALTAELDKFHEDDGGFNTEAAAKWLLENYKLERK